MRNLSMGFLVLYMGLFLIVPVIIVAVGSLHQWNPLNETWKWIGLENYVRMFSYPTFWLAMIRASSLTSTPRPGPCMMSI